MTNSFAFLAGLLLATILIAADRKPGALESAGARQESDCEHTCQSGIFLVPTCACISLGGVITYNKQGSCYPTSCTEESPCELAVSATFSVGGAPCNQGNVVKARETPLDPWHSPSLTVSSYDPKCGLGEPVGQAGLFDSSDATEPLCVTTLVLACDICGSPL